MEMTFESGRLPRSIVVYLYMYARGHSEVGGEPFLYLTTTVQREKGSTHNIRQVIDHLYGQMAQNLWAGRAKLPEGAWRILPDIYLHIVPYVRKIFNVALICKRKDNPHYAVHNIITNGLVPTRPQIVRAAHEAFNQSAVQPKMFEAWAIKHCLNDAWANMGVVSTKQWMLWMHVKELKVKKFTYGTERTIDEILDHGEPGDSWSRLEQL